MNTNTPLQRGFTLMEVMIVVAIVAMLAAIAVPNYQQYVQRSRRAEAIAALEAITVGLEKHYLNSNAYTTDIGELPVSGTGLKVSGSNYYSASGYYQLAIVQSGSVFMATATVVAGTPQASDEECAAFGLTTSGDKSAKDSGGSDATGECWTS